MNPDVITRGGHDARPSLGSLLASMVKVGVIGFGGGSALIPVMEDELVRRKGFLSERAYTLHTVVANITPGALPVKLAALAGGRSHSPLASLLCAFAVALPGTAATVGLVAAFDLLGPGAVRYVEFAAVGIASFIIVLLLHYIMKVLHGGGPRAPAYVVIMFVAWFLTGAGGLVRLGLLLFGVELTIDVPSLSAVGLIVAALVAIGVYSIFRRGQSGGADSEMAAPLPELRPKVVAIYLFLAACVAALLLAVVMGGPAVELMGLVGFSTVTSFGGGEAYVGVADGFFVASGLIDSPMFYGQLVPVANALPGPILVKLAAGIGYAYGTALGGPSLGFVFALAAFVMAIGACCAVVIGVVTAWTKVAQSAFMVNLGRFILPVICGLLLSTSVSMIIANAEIAERAHVAAAPVAWGTLAAVGVLWALRHRARIHDLLLLAGAGAASLIVLALMTAGQLGIAG